jgi:hypothetical protein
MFRSCAVLALAALALAGCSRVEASTPKSVAATPSLPCTLPYGTDVALLSPQPGSFGVPAGSAPLLLVASHDLAKTVAVVATDAKGVTTRSAALERTAKPIATPAPPFSDPVYYRAVGLGLHAHRHYTIALDDLAQNGCAPYAKITGDSRFST